MSSSRAESQQPPYGRKRSNTAQSIIRPPPAPCRVGDQTTLTLWVHEPITASVEVIFNPDYWPGIGEGDLIEVTTIASSEDELKEVPSSPGFLFTVRRDENLLRPGLQLSASKALSEAFGLRSHSNVTLTKVDKSKKSAEYIEITFQDQYLGRCDMWRLGEQLKGQCIYVNQEVSFIGSTAGRIRNIYIGGKEASAGYFTASTRAIYRSLSAKVTIFIQVCRELWEFATDGERYNEKIAHSFLPALFRKWREAGTNHIVTIVLISRVFYTQEEIEFAAGPLQRDDEGNWYKDFFKVITDLELVQDWKPTLVSLKVSFWDFQRDILLTHHYHRAKGMTSLDGSSNSFDQVPLVGTISFAHDGPILEALNLALNPTETHYVDRSLSLTGVSMILITPGTGYYRVPKRLLRLTTTRMLDQGFSLDLVSLAKPPLHQSPIFSFLGVEPELRPEADSRSGGRTHDPLWGGNDDGGNSSKEKTLFWWCPFWITASFWDVQVDLPFREDRFVARARMQQIQMLGLLEHDGLPGIKVPFLPDLHDTTEAADEGHMDKREINKMQRDKFDLDTFALRKEPIASNMSRASIGSSGGTIGPSSFHGRDRRVSLLRRPPSSKIGPIEESPRVIYKELPDDGHVTPGGSTSSRLSVLGTSPSQSSILSADSSPRDMSESPQTPRPMTNQDSQASFTSKLSSSWFFNPFRSSSSTQLPNTSSQNLLSQPPIAPNNVPETRVHVEQAKSALLSVSRPPPTAAQPVQSGAPRPVAIRHTPSRHSTLSQRSEDDTLVGSPRAQTIRNSPSNASPRDDLAYFARRPLTSHPTPPYSAHVPRTNPLRTMVTLPYTQTSLASRFGHQFPQPLHKHQIKWKSMVTPACLSLTTEYFPTKAELDSCYDVHNYDFVVDPSELRSFFIKSNSLIKESSDQARHACAMIVLRGMTSLRLAQGFQFVVRKKGDQTSRETSPRKARYYAMEDDDSKRPKPHGASDVLKSIHEPVYLSMSNEIHRLSYSDETIKVRRYVRRMPPSSLQPFQYRCLVWPKLGEGYTEHSASFLSHGLENYGWNRMDMLVAGYEHQFNESLRYWRTRFIVIPSLESPPTLYGPSGDKLDDEEVRLLGTDKLADLFSKIRWSPSGLDEKQVAIPAVRFIPTYLGPIASVQDDYLVSQLEEIHSAGPLGKKMKSEKEIAEMTMTAIAKAMREESGVPIKEHRWHVKVYPDSFTGYDFVSWLVREFRDVPTREHAVEWGIKLMEQGLMEHCRALHGFLDGHYFYRLKGEYAIPVTPSRRWFRQRVSAPDETRTPGFYPSSVPRPSGLGARRQKKRLVVSQTMVIDTDPQKKSDQAESVILHYDIIHNAANVLHFELNWIGTTARCIEEQLRLWSRTIEKYGLRLVEAYVTQISDIRERNPFQSCYPIRIAYPPPIVADLARRLPEGMQPRYFFEYALLRKFNFILDVEGADMYPDRMEVLYTYRRSPFTYSQFVHRTGVAFVQVLGGSRGFLFLTNRLMGAGRASGTQASSGSGGTNANSSKNQTNRLRPAEAAEGLRKELDEFCSDAKALNKFYDEQLALLPTTGGSIDAKGPEDIPELTI